MAAIASVNRILDAILTRLATIDPVGAPSTWASTKAPATIRRELKVSTVTNDVRPALAVSVKNYRAELIGGGLHEVMLEVGIVCITEPGDGGTGDTAAVAMAHDIDKVIRQDETLGINPATLSINWINPFEYTLDSDLSQATGLCVSEIAFTLKYRTDHSAV